MNMLLFELATKEQGTYIAVKLDKESQEKIVDFIKEHKIPNGVPADKLHATVIYSLDYVSNAKKLVDKDMQFEGRPTKFDSFDGDTKNLVLLFECDDLLDRHEYFKKHGATHTYDEFKPHITLSYDVEDFNIKNLPKFTEKLTLINEYTQPLDTEWTKKLND